MPVLAPDAVIASLRRPRYLFTDSYLNDPIEIFDQPAFLPQTVIAQLNAYIVLPRDHAEFAVVELNPLIAQEQFYVASMYSRTINRDDYNRIVDRRLKQLPVADLPFGG